MIRDYEMACTVLGISQDATQAQRKSAYRELTKRLHPDNHPNQTERIREAYRLVVEAYEYLEQHPGEALQKKASATSETQAAAASVHRNMTTQNCSPKVMGNPLGKSVGSVERRKERQKFDEKAKLEREARREQLQEDLQVRKEQLDQEKKERAILNEIRAIRLAHAIRAMLSEQGIE